MQANEKTNGELDVIRGTDNIFADLQLPTAGEDLAKAEVAAIIRERVRGLGMTQQATAKILGTTQAKVSLLMGGKVSGFSLERLLRYLNALNMDVRISIKPLVGDKLATTQIVLS